MRRMGLQGVVLALVLCGAPGWASADEDEAKKEPYGAGLPRISIALGAGHQQLASTPFFTAAVEFDARVIGPLHIGVSVRPAVGPAGSGAPGIYPGGGDRPLLISISPGATFVFDLPVRPRVGAHVQLAPNPDGPDPDLGPVLVGFNGVIGVDIPLPKTPLAVRIGGEFGNLDRFFVARALGSLVVEFGH